MTPKEICAAYDTLIDRATAALSGAPFWQYIDEDNPARLVIEGDTATLEVADAVSGYEGLCLLEIEKHSFPVELLTIPDAAFAQWKAAEDRRYHERKAENRAKELAASKVAKEARDRSEYARLVKKFGPSGK